MKKRDFLKLVGKSMIVAGVPWTKALGQTENRNPSGRRLNLLYITVDDMNGNSPGFMGNPLKLTPNLDAFAATANRMVNNFAAAPICQPSREAMMTGLMPHRNGGLGFNPIREGVPTLVTILKSQGYFTGGINKIEHMQPPSCFPWDKTWKQSGKNPAALGQQVAEAIKDAQTAHKPFFINCNITDPHRPFYPAVTDRDGLTGTIPNVLHAKDVTVPSFLEELPPVRQEVAKYYNSIQRLDESFGNIMKALAASGEEANTMVIFVADHGMSFPFSKATVYTNGAWTPAVLRWPGMGTPQAFEEFTSSTDILPTLLGLLNVAPPADLDGRSWVPLFQGQQQADRDHAISNVNSTASHHDFPQRSVQFKDRALIFAPWSDGKTAFHVEAMDGLSFKAMEAAAQTNPVLQARMSQYLYGYPMAYYNLAKDPDQRTNVINDPQYKNEIAKAQKILLDYMVKTKDPQLANLKAALARAGTPVES